MFIFEFEFAGDSFRSVLNALRLSVGREQQRESKRLLCSLRNAVTTEQCFRFSSGRRTRTRLLHTHICMHIPCAALSLSFLSLRTFLAHALRTKRQCINHANYRFKPAAKHTQLHRTCASEQRQIDISDTDQLNRREILSSREHRERGERRTICRQVCMLLLYPCAISFPIYIFIFSHTHTHSLRLSIRYNTHDILIHHSDGAAASSSLFISTRTRTHTYTRSHTHRHAETSCPCCLATTKQSSATDDSSRTPE